MDENLTLSLQPMRLKWAGWKHSDLSVISIPKRHQHSKNDQHVASC